MGERIRALRIARGMTQADVAGSDFSKGFISLVETGRTRVSLRAAEILANRLGTSAPELIATSATNVGDHELLLVRAEQQIASGHAAEAVKLLESVVTDATGLTRARAMRTRGRALVESGHAKEGLVLLEDAARNFMTLGNPELHARTSYDRALAHAHLNEPGNTLALALECEAAMRAHGIVDRTLELQLRTLLAATFARANDLDSADVQVRQALDLAKDVVDSGALGTLYSTLSVTSQRKKDLDGALAYARKSLAIYEDLDRARAVGQMWHNMATIHLQRGDLRRTEDAIERAQGIADETQIPALAARLVSLRAEVAIARRQWDAAEQLADEAAAHPGASAYTRGRSLLSKARALAAKRAPTRKIRETLDEAVSALRSEPPRVRAEAHECYAEVLAQRGEWKTAYDEALQALALSRTSLR